MKIQDAVIVLGTGGFSLTVGELIKLVASELEGGASPELEAITSRLTAVEESGTQISSRMSALETATEDFPNRLTSLEVSKTAMQGNISDLDSRVTALESASGG